MESPDPWLIIIGPYAPLPIRKTAGKPTGGLMTFMHCGEGGLFDVGYGITLAWLTGHDRPFQYFTSTHVWMPSTLDPRPSLWISRPLPSFRQGLLLEGDMTP